MATYYVYIKPEVGKELRELLKAHPSPIAKRVLNELNGIGEIDKGLRRQMIVSKSEFRLVTQLVKDNNLDMELANL